jgi:hypothetical protein
VATATWNSKAIYLHSLPIYLILLWFFRVACLPLETAEVEDSEEIPAAAIPEVRWLPLHGNEISGRLLTKKTDNNNEKKAAMIFLFGIKRIACKIKRFLLRLRFN